MTGGKAMRLPDDRSDKPGVPFSIIIPKPYKEVYEVGDTDAGEGAKVGIYGGNILFQASCGGMEITMGVTIEHMLDMIGEFNRSEGN